jgi:outer membrane protein assembly factor BamE (lipoprotein component of BamABCDE complex)
MKILILLTFFLLFANCTNKLAIDHHGVHKLNIKQEKLFPSETNKNDIIKILGPPSTVSFFDNEILFFIERKETNGSIMELGRRKIITNNVLIVEINKYGLLEKKTFYDLTKMQEIKISKNTTEVDYQKDSFIYDFLSSMRQKINDPLGKRRKN